MPSYPFILGLILTLSFADNDSPFRNADEEPGEVSTSSGEHDEPLINVIMPVVNTVVGLVKSVHAEVAQFMPGEVAWGVMVGAPILLPLAYVGVGKWSRRRRLKKSRKQKQREEQKKPTGLNLSERKDVTQSGVRESKSAMVRLPEHQLLEKRDTHGVAFLHMAFGVGLGVDELKDFRTVARSVFSHEKWKASVSAQDAQALQKLRLGWAVRVAGRRCHAWLAAQPPIMAEGLRVELAANVEEAGPSGLTVIDGHGLGARLQPEQQALTQRARKALAIVVEHPHDALGLMSAEKQLGLPLGLTSETEGAAPTSLVDLTLLHGGVTMLQRCIDARVLSQYAGEELLHALQQHQDLVHTPVPAEGCAVHALHHIHGGNLIGTGTLLAAVAGAAFSSSSVVMRLSRHASAVNPTSLRELMKRLGVMVMEALRNPKAGDGAIIVANTRRLLGIKILEQESQRAEEVLRIARKQSAKDPLWEGAKNNKAPFPDVALAELYHSRIEELRKESQAALVRLLEIIDQLAFEGDKGENQYVAQYRVGYVVAGLGIPLVQSTTVELLSLTREIIAEVKETPQEIDKSELLV